MFKPVKYIKKHFKESLSKHKTFHNSVPSLLLKKDIQESVNYAEKNMENCMMFFESKEIWNFVISKLNHHKNQTALEFGGFQGTSINHLSNGLKNMNFHGFDSFEGLQEDWTGWSLRKGAFNLNGEMPKVNQNVTLHKGWFDNSLPNFIKENRLEDLVLIHIDSDTYEACVTILENLKPFIKSNTFILFDEYFGYRGWKLGEFKAFQEFVEKHNVNYEYKAFAERQVLIQVK